jgi:glycine betaine/proline transport system substrate-binding protein
MRKILRTLSIAGTVAVGLVTAIGLPRTGNADVPESQDTIKIALFDWTSVNVNAKILGGILHRLGYNVDYVTADYLSSLTTGLTTGDIDVITEEWDTTAGDAMKASDATGKTERLGKLGPKAKEDW